MILDTGQTMELAITIIPAKSTTKIRSCKSMRQLCRTISRLGTFRCVFACRRSIHLVMRFSSLTLGGISRVSTAVRKTGQRCQAFFLTEFHIFTTRLDGLFLLTIDGGEQTILVESQSLSCVITFKVT